MLVILTEPTSPPVICSVSAQPVRTFTLRKKQSNMTIDSVSPTVFIRIALFGQYYLLFVIIIVR